MDRGSAGRFERSRRNGREKNFKKITWLSRNFENIIPEPLSGEFKGAYKLRIGVWRVVYTFDKETIVIHHIGHRREIYKI